MPVVTGPADGRAGCRRPAATPYRAVVVANAGDQWAGVPQYPRRPSPWQRRLESFRGNTEAGGGGPSDDSCATRPRIRPRHPVGDRTVVTDLVWWLKVLQRSRGEA